MKKFILLLVLLIIAAGVVFYFGWINVEPGKFVIAHSTLTGTTGYPLESGELNWLWQKLVPRSFHQYEIDKEPYRIQYDISYQLPGSEELQEYGNFTLGLTVMIQYSVDFESAVILLDRGIIENSNDYFSEQFKTQIEDTVTGFILENMAQYSLMSRSFDYAALEYLRELLRGSVSDFSANYKLKDINTTVTFTEIPQVESYREALRHYFEYMETLSKLTDERAARDAELQLIRDEDDIEIARLKKYGELISQYPLLLKYFYIQKFGEKTRVLVLPQDETTGFPKMLEPEDDIVTKEFIPMEHEMSIEPEIEEETEEETSASQGDFVDDTQKEKWYRYLKFWEYITKQ